MILKFGKVIKIDDKDYVYLAASEVVVYLAHILDPKITDEILNRYLRLRDSASKKSHPTFKVIRLTTKEFKDKGAHCYHTGQDSDILEVNPLSVLGDLNEPDKQAIREELLLDDGFVDKELQELIRRFSGLDN